MKGFSIFLSVLIFLLAAVSAVFSFFLFEKRAQLVDGWNDMAGKINETAAALDAGSGTAVAAQLTSGAMNQTKYADLPALLPKLPALAKQIIAERDSLAAGLAALGGVLEMRGLSAEQFQDVGKYADSLTKLQNYVKAYQTRNNAILNSLSRSARQLGANITVAQLKSTGYAAAYQNLDSRITYYLNRDRAFTQRVRNIASAIGSKTPNLDERNYASGLQGVLTDATALKRRATELDASLKDARRTIANLEQVVKEKNGQIADLTAQRDRKDKELYRICRALGLETPKSPMEDGSAEAMQLVRTQEKGKVIEVDGKFGFLVISLGKNTRVEEPFGNRINSVDPKIAENMILTIARNMPSGEAEYINKVKLVKVDDNCSIGELTDLKGGKRPQAGDMVFFGDDEIAKIVKDRK